MIDITAAKITADEAVAEIRGYSEAERATLVAEIARWSNFFSTARRGGWKLNGGERVARSNMIPLRAALGRIDPVRYARI